MITAVKKKPTRKWRQAVKCSQDTYGLSAHGLWWWWWNVLHQSQKNIFLLLFKVFVILFVIFMMGLVSHHNWSFVRFSQTDSDMSKCYCIHWIEGLCVTSPSVIIDFEAPVYRFISMLNIFYHRRYSFRRPHNLHHLSLTFTVTRTISAKMVIFLDDYNNNINNNISL